MGVSAGYPAETPNTLRARTRPPPTRHPQATTPRSAAQSRIRLVWDKLGGSVFVVADLTSCPSGAAAPRSGVVRTLVRSDATAVRTSVRFADDAITCGAARPADVPRNRSGWRQDLEAPPSGASSERPAISPSKSSTSANPLQLSRNPSRRYVLGCGHDATFRGHPDAFPGRPSSGARNLAIEIDPSAHLVRAGGVAWH